jgi:hypothetical protein
LQITSIIWEFVLGLMNGSFSLDLRCMNQFVLVSNDPRTSLSSSQPVQSALDGAETNSIKHCLEKED